MMKKAESEFIASISKHPKFQKDGTLDGDLFYNQKDGSTDCRNLTSLSRLL